MAKKYEITELPSVNMDAFLAAKQLDDIRIKALDYSIKNGLLAAQVKYPTLHVFLSKWEGKNSGDYIEKELGAFDIVE